MYRLFLNLLKPIIYLDLGINSFINFFCYIKAKLNLDLSFFKNISFNFLKEIFLKKLKSFIIFGKRSVNLTDKLKAPSLNVYYPLKSSIFSITIRIMGVLTAFILCLFF